MMELTLPKEPVDKYRVDFWSLSISEHWYYIKSMSATYYVNTPYAEYRPGVKHGAPLVDDWMLAEDGHPTGRICGWANFSGRADAWYSTRAEAVRAALAYYRKRVVIHEQTITRLTGYIAAMAGEQRAYRRLHGGAS